jgi:hypothetical protein
LIRPVELVPLEEPVLRLHPGNGRLALLVRLRMPSFSS